MAEAVALNRRRKSQVVKLLSIHLDKIIDFRDMRGKNGATNKEVRV